MQPTDFRRRLRAGERLIGTMVTLPTAATAEILADAGFDWLFIDAEHGPLDTGDILGILQAVGDRVPCVVRVPQCDEGWIKRVLDVGAQGVIVPQTNTPEMVADVVRYARYAPIGSRGVGLARAHGYGFRFDEYVASANEHIAVIVQAEHKLAVENIEAIVAVEGIDAVLLGPYDLSASLGKMGQINDSEVTSAIDHVVTTCKSADISIGSFGVTADAVREYAEQGISLLCAGVDVLFLGGGARKMRSELASES
ncbi:MAG: aldolase/citrate lyase family protein [Fuerstiella sp.]